MLSSDCWEACAEKVSWATLRFCKKEWQKGISSSYTQASEGGRQHTPHIYLLWLKFLPVLAST